MCWSSRISGRQTCIDRLASALWTPIQALDRMRVMLGGLVDGADLLSFLPPITADLPNRVLRVRGAVASSLVAALELARNGVADLQQDEPFGRIAISPVNAPLPEHQLAD